MVIVKRWVVSKLVKKHRIT